MFAIAGLQSVCHTKRIGLCVFYFLTTFLMSVRLFVPFIKPKAKDVRMAAI
jgi:hypothetical protein